MSSTPSEVVRDIVCDSTYSTGTFGSHGHPISAADELGLEELRLSLASSSGAGHLSREDRADAQAPGGHPPQSTADEDAYEKLPNPLEADRRDQQQQQQAPRHGPGDSPVVPAAAEGASQAAYASPPPGLAISPSYPAPAPTLSHASSPTESTSPSVLSNGSQDSSSPLMATIAERSPTPGPAATLARVADVEGAMLERPVLPAEGDASTRTTSKPDDGSVSLSSEGLTAKEKAVLMRRARKLEKVLGSTLQEHQVTHSLSYPRAAPLDIVSEPSPASRRLSDSASSPSVSYASSPSSPLGAEMRRRSAALSFDSSVSPSSDQSPSASTRRRRSSVSTLDQRASWFSVDPSSPTRPSMLLTPLTDAQRRLRLNKIHHLLGTEVGAEHVFASTPGAGPWLEVSDGGPGLSQDLPDEAKGGWKGALGKAKDTLGRSAHASRNKGQTEDAVDLASGDEGDTLSGLRVAANGDRMGGVKRGAKLNNIFGDFPPADLFNLRSPAGTDVDAATLPASESLSVSYLPSSLYLAGRRNSSQSSFSVYDASIAHLDYLLRTDPEALSAIMSTIHDGADHSPTHEAPGPASPSDPAASLQSDVARRRQAAKKLSHFFGMPASALGLFQSTLDTLQEGVREERELGLLAEGEERGLLGRLDGLRKRAARELRFAEGDEREE